MSRRGWMLFAAMSVIWGIPYLMIKVAVEELSPSTLVLARCAIATVLLLPIALLRGQIRPLLPRWKPLLAYTAVEICGPWLLLGFAEQRLSSSLTGLLIAGVPLVGALLARLGPDQERLGAAPADRAAGRPGRGRLRWSASRPAPATRGRSSRSPWS